MPKIARHVGGRQAKRLRSVAVSSLGCRSGLRASIGREFEHGFAHFLAGFEFDNSARRNADVVFRSIRVAANPGLAYFHLEDAKVSQFDLLPLSNSFSDVIQGFLDHFEDALLDQAGFFADADYQVTFCHRTLRVGCSDAGRTLHPYKPRSFNGQARTLTKNNPSVVSLKYLYTGCADFGFWRGATREYPQRHNTSFRAR